MSKKPKKETKPVGTLAEAPARIRETHVRDRLVDERDREPRGWRNVDWPIQRAYETGRLSTPVTNGRQRIAETDANTRWAAMLEYSEVHDLALRRSGRDSTDLDIVSGGSGFPISEAMSDAIKKLISIDSHMSKKDRRIVRMLAEGHRLPDAVEKACGEDFKFTVSARVRDALDALDNAIETAREGGFQYVRMVGT